MVVVKVLFFASLRSLTGKQEMDIDLGIGGEEARLTRLISLIESQFPDLDMKTSQVSVAVNKLYAREDVLLKDGDIVAFLPPISGG